VNRWYFWVLAPIMLATALGMPFLVEPPTTFGWVVTYVFSGALLFATLSLARPRRFRWALRVVAAAILLAYLAYAVSELVAWWNGKPFGWNASRSESNLHNALWGLFVFGAPSLYFILKGRSNTKVDELLDVDEDRA
jgi:hypothetical protein